MESVSSQSSDEAPEQSRPADEDDISDEEEDQEEEKEAEEEEEEDAYDNLNEGKDANQEDDKDDEEEEVEEEEEFQSNLSFGQLGLASWLVNALKAMSISKPSEIQTKCIPEILAGKDVIGGAKTGSGKTAAFALPILQRLSEDPYGVFAVILTPTRYMDDFDPAARSHLNRNK